MNYKQSISVYNFLWVKWFFEVKLYLYNSKNTSHYKLNGSSSWKVKHTQWLQLKWDYTAAIAWLRKTLQGVSRLERHYIIKLIYPHTEQKIDGQNGNNLHKATSVHQVNIFWPKMTYVDFLFQKVDTNALSKSSMVPKPADNKELLQENKNVNLVLSYEMNHFSPCCGISVFFKLNTNKI